MPWRFSHVLWFRYSLYGLYSWRKNYCKFKTFITNVQLKYSLFLKDINVTSLSSLSNTIPYTEISFDVKYSGSASFIYVTTSEGAVSSYDANVTQPIRVTQTLINTGITSFEFSASTSSADSVNVSLFLILIL